MADSQFCNGRAWLIGSEEALGSTLAEAVSRLQKCEPDCAVFGEPAGSLRDKGLIRLSQSTLIVPAL